MQCVASCNRIDGISCRGFFAIYLSLLLVEFDLVLDGRLVVQRNRFNLE